MKNLELAQPSRKMRVTQLGIIAGLAVLFLALLLWGLQGVPPAHADPGILYVEGVVGQDIGTCGTTSAPCKTISYTLNIRATGGDVIRVAQGVYTENLTVDKQVTLEGGYVPSGTLWLTRTGETVIDGSNSRTVWGDWDGSGVHMSIVISDAGTYKMWYAGWGLRDQGFGLATSTNGITWTKYAGNPVFTATVDWEAGSVGHPHVIKDGTTYKMWYGPNDERIGYAWSSDGIHWTKYANNPILEGTPGAWDEDGVGAPFVIKLGHSDYRMWYQSGGQIGYATSADGVEWTKHISPVLTPGPGGAWDDSGVWDPNVLYQGGLYHMWYAGHDGDTFRIGYASSSDGINWNKSASNPLLSFGAPGEWDEGGVSEPNVLFDGALYRMWFSGWQSGWQNVQRGYATSLSGVNWTKYANNPVLSPGTLGQWGQPVVAFTSGSDGSVLDGFTVRNGEAECGGGVQINSTDVTIRNCTVISNTAQGSGGGICITGISTATIFGSVIYSNTAATGGGGGLVADTNSTFVVSSSQFLDNFAGCCGGGMAAWGWSQGKIISNTFDGNSARDWMGGGIYLDDGSYDVFSNTVTHNRTLHAAGGGIAVGSLPGATDATIIGNLVVSNTGREYGGGIAVAWGAKVVVQSNQILSNTSHDWFGSGLSIVTAEALVDSNLIAYNVNDLNVDGAGAVGIAMDGPSQLVTITNNVIVSNTDKGIMVSDGVYDLKVVNNTIVSNRNEGILAWGIITVPLLRNNIIASNGYCGIAAAGGAQFQVIDHNDVWQNGGGSDNYCAYGGAVNPPAPGPGDISADPLFVDAANGDYHLRADSPCIDAGTSSGAPSVDIEGTPRDTAPDIGAYEWGKYRIFLPLTLRNVGS